MFEKEVPVLYGNIFSLMIIGIFFSDSSVFPHYKWKSIGVTKTFQILYRNDEILLDEVFVFRATILVDSNKVRYAL